MLPEVTNPRMNSTAEGLPLGTQCFNYLFYLKLNNVKIYGICYHQKWQS